MATRRTFVLVTLAAALACLAGPLLAQAAPDEPGPLTIDSEIDFWGAYKSVTVDVAIERRPGKKPLTSQIFADADRHPPSGGFRESLYIKVMNLTVGGYDDMERDDAPPLFQLLDRACPKLLNAC